MPISAAHLLLNAGANTSPVSRRRLIDTDKTWFRQKVESIWTYSLPVRFFKQKLAVRTFQTARSFPRISLKTGIRDNSSVSNCAKSRQCARVRSGGAVRLLIAAMPSSTKPASLTFCVCWTMLTAPFGRRFHPHHAAADTDKNDGRSRTRSFANTLPPARSPHMQRNVCRHAPCAWTWCNRQTDVGKDFAAVLVDMYQAVGKRLIMSHHRILRQSPYAVLAFGQIQLITPLKPISSAQSVVDGFNVIGSSGYAVLCPQSSLKNRHSVSSKTHGTS